jgi:hypothetical protein
VSGFASKNKRSLEMRNDACSLPPFLFHIHIHSHTHHQLATAAESGKKRSARRAFHISNIIFFSLKKCDVLDKTDSPFPRAAERVNWATEIINKSAEQTAA